MSSHRRTAHPWQKVRAFLAAPQSMALPSPQRVRALLASSRHRPALAALLTGVVVIGLSMTVLAVRSSAATGRSSSHAARAGLASNGAKPAAASPDIPPPGAPTSSAPTPPASSPAAPGASGSTSPSASASARPSVPVTGLTGSQNLTGSQAVALTFDDGPDPHYTPVVLDVLKEFGVKATFCVVGRQARDHPDLVKRIHAEGHALCNHSWQHLINLGQRDYSYQSWDLDETNKAIRAAVPDAEIKYFRAPGGNFTQGLIDLGRLYGMAPLGWDVDPKDWDAKHHGNGAAMVNHIVSAVQQHTRPGSVVLSHDRGHPDTPTAYRTLLPWLQERYQLIALP